MDNMEMIKDIRERVVRIENKLLQGGGWHCDAHSGLCAKVSVILGISSAVLIGLVGKVLYDYMAM